MLLCMSPPLPLSPVYGGDMIACNRVDLNSDPIDLFVDPIRLIASSC